MGSLRDTVAEGDLRASLVEALRDRGLANFILARRAERLKATGAAGSPYFPERTMP